MIRKNDTTVRCAIYTRKSTEEGLEQEFNTLDAQREAAEAFILSQKAEGWRAIAEYYDDGGFTGGNMERPALKRLLADIEAGQVDCVIVYKVDRLSRSLLDFARMMEVFDRQGVSFVSVTQQFNTTHSMGRLTLNILLSFAQFEREIIGERTRDKMAAAKRKGKWVGGHPVLGYDIDPDGGRLIVNDDEAERVRDIFALYAEYQALLPTVRELQRCGWATKRWTTRKGRERGGRAFSKSALQHLLTNVLYIGKQTYYDEVHDGEQPAIVNQTLWDTVQNTLQENRPNRGRLPRNKNAALLKGLLVCEPCGCAMVPTYTTKKQKRYRYYVCSGAQRRGWDSCPTRSVPAAEMERFIVDHIRRVGRDPGLIKTVLTNARRKNGAALRTLKAADLARALERFDPVWDALNPQERVRIVRLLVERVSYDGESGTVAVTFRPTGIKTLAEEEAGA